MFSSLVEQLFHSSVLQQRRLKGKKLQQRSINMRDAIPTSGMKSNEKDNVAFRLDASQPDENPSCCVSLSYGCLKWQNGDVRRATRLPSNQGSIVGNLRDVRIRTKISPEMPKLVYSLTQPWPRQRQRRMRFRLLIRLTFISRKRKTSIYLD